MTSKATTRSNEAAGQGQRLAGALQEASGWAMRVVLAGVCDRVGGDVHADDQDAATRASSAEP